MAFTRPAGKHRRPSRMKRTTNRTVGVAALATTGVVGTLAAPALAAESPAEQTLTQAVIIGDTVADQADQIDAQAAAQQQAADETAAREKAEADAKERAKEAAEKAKKEREVKVRAARAAERERLLNSYTAPISGSYVSTGYKTGGAVWSSGSHTGIDFHAASGTAVHAVGAGTVVEAGWGGSYGNEVVIKMDDGTYTQYGHMSSLGVSVGQTVTPGQQIGLSGATGNVTGAHLHFEARTSAEYGSDIDPLGYLRQHGVNV
ncbi:MULTISPECIES: M23 family metallopeptidase [unclassified Streptomyces]|uniref:M23 family metallopeptidase n=1 Tax=unclassified Streptomyces TaxID=2593676 RepID=UPI0033F46BFB